MMPPSFLVLFMLVLFPCSQVSGSAPTHWKVCGSDRVAYSKSSDGYHLFVNEGRIEDFALICEALEFYSASGCFSRDPQLEEWGRIAEQYCDRDFTPPPPPPPPPPRNPVSVGYLRSAGRKVLLQPPANTSIPDRLSRGSRSQEEQQDCRFPLDKALAVPGMFLLCCGALCPCFRAKRKTLGEHNALAKELSSRDSASFDINSASEKTSTTPLRVPPSPSRFSMSPQLNRIGSIHLSINQIFRATQNFSPSLRLGDGGFWTGYKAVLPDGQVVAIKRAKKEHFSALRDEFSNEVELLSKIEHRNLVKLLGYTDKANERIIITEYVPNGTLREHLDGQHGTILDFNQRLEIAIDVAHALTYLHLYAEKPIIHRDVKSSNILLTESYRAKVSDFGFARIGATDADQTHVMTKAKGTAGYLDPEYLRTYQLTPKSDVFSFGILLIEILSGRRPVESKRAIDERITVRWAFNKYDEGNLRSILDPLLNEVVDEEVLAKMIGLAFQCAAPTRVDRPVMKDVVEQLWEIRKDYGRSRGR